MKHQVLFSLKIKKNMTTLVARPEAQLVASLTADPGVASSIVARSDTFVEIDHEIISTFIILLPTGLCSTVGKVPKSQVAICFLRNTGKDPLKKQLVPLGSIASPGRSLQPSVKYVDDLKKAKKKKNTLSGPRHLNRAMSVLFLK